MILMALMLAMQQAPTPPAASDDIVVTAHGPIDNKTAAHFVNDISVRAEAQLARFKDPVCPAVFGFPSEYATVIVSRIRTVARQAGAQVAKPGCQPNVVLVQTDDGRAFVKNVREKSQGWLNGVPSHDIDRLVTREGPVRSWTSVSVANEDGQRMSNGTFYVKTGSVFNPQSQQIIDAATVVIDTQSVIGKTLRQLADYTVMRTLAKTKPPEGDAVGTVLALFDGNPNVAPQGLTQADLGYLKALYAMPGNRTITHQRGRIAQQLRKGG